MTRIALKSGCIEVCLDDLGDTHLGDQVLIDLDIQIHRVQHAATGTGAELTTES
jgi:hypothetical protein